MKNEKINVQKKSKKRLLLVLVFILLVFIYFVISLRGEYLEILEIGDNYIQVFEQNIKYKMIVSSINFSILFLSIYITNKIIKKGLKKFFDEENKKIPKLPNKSIAFIASTIITIISSNLLVEKSLLAFNSAWFGINDTVFNLDIGYYVFQKPFIEFIILYFIFLIIALTIYIIAYYIITFNVCFEEGINSETLKKNTFIKQIIANIILVTIGISLLVLFKTQNILFEKFLKLQDELNTSLFGAGFIDVTIKLWGYRILAILIVLCVIVALKYFKKLKMKKGIIALSIVPIYLVSMFLIMIIFNWIFIGNSQLDKQKVYIEENIKNTKNAYNINIEEKEIEYSGIITYEDITKYEDVLQNIAIINKEATLKNLEQYQTSAGYYSFSNAKIQNYSFNGENKLVYINTREIINSNNRTYNNKTYEYTHGFGIVVTSAVETDETGNVKYIQNDFEEENAKIKITQPRIYFGLETNDTIVTNTKNKTEFDYPITSDTNKENVYDGEAGLNLSFLDRLILGIKQNNIKIAISGSITNESKILTNRNVIQRVKKIMPYLIYDEKPYMVVTDEGKLVWVIDAYTTTNYYPYSQETIIEVDGMKRTINYIRNSIKVLVDAYDGTVKFYITDKTDPIAMAYRNIYSGMFIEEEIPEDISNHIVYSEYLYNIQSQVISQYHKIQPEVLYRGDDIWEITKQNTTKVNSTTGSYMKPYYTMVKTVDNDTSNLGLVIPYTPLGKQNIVSYLVGTYDSQNKEKLTLYRFKSSSNVLGTMQLEKQIEQDETISKELETVNVTGTKLQKNIIVVPINNTLLYVEPIYQITLNDKQQVPVLKKVIVASGNKVSIGNTIQEALKNLLSQYAVDIEIENNDSIEDLIDAIIKANNNLNQSNENNDWEMIGKDIDKLQNLIAQLEILVEEDKKQKIQENSIIGEITNSIFNQDIVE